MDDDKEIKSVKKINDTGKGPRIKIWVKGSQMEK